MKFRPDRRIAVSQFYPVFFEYYPFCLTDLPGENWCYVHTDKSYLISTFGRVKSLKKNSIKILRPFFNARGYLCVHLSRNGKQQKICVHRLVALAFVANPANKPQVDHIDGNKWNNHFSNLRWATASENTQAAHDLGLMPTPHGDESVRAKLTKNQVLFVRENPQSLTVYELADMFGVDAKTISRIQTGQTYKNIGGKIRETLKQPVPENIKRAIKAEYKQGVKGHGTKSLAKKFGYSTTTIVRIVRQ